MIRTLVAARGSWPERAVLIGQARAIPKAWTFIRIIADPVTCTCHFFEGAGHRMAALIEEGVPCSRLLAEIKATIGFIFSVPRI
jgi:hypothetical protein